jgi:hypothetical protein
MSQRPVKIFNVFDLQYGPNTADHLHIQETIDYCESRFRVILSVFARAGVARQRVIQRCLHKELVCVLKYTPMQLRSIFVGIRVSISRHGRRNWSIH